MFSGLDIETRRFLAPCMRRFSAASFFVGPMYKHPSTVLCIILIRRGLLTGNGGSFATCPILREKRKAFNLLFAALGIKNTAYGSRASPACKSKVAQSVTRVSSDLESMTRRRKTWRVHRARLEWLTNFVDSSNYGCSCTIAGELESSIQ